MHASAIDRRQLLRLGGLVAGGAVVTQLGFAVEADAAVATSGRVKGNVYVRSGAGTAYRPLGVLKKGTTVAYAGAVKAGRWQPIGFNGTVGYVSNTYLVATLSAAARPTTPAAKPAVVAKPAAGHASLAVAHRVALPQGCTARGRAIGAEVHKNFPQVASMLGRRNDPGSDHNSGRAVDIMLPGNYKAAAQRALGAAIAAHLRANASRLGVDYVIWDQHIWSVARSKEGWRAMADRGSDNANHKNHVHVSVK